ncbi:hypothetical protein CTheo_3525 [Ceratobasidium theobromae]|uniref:Uncharacterized protein n=1 Tax=Ceratobasidium theobromae TaxID=1582974 RepID=A0A5N5QMR3_9AGAM|nr:hypothetical protein CTheo_3525 [Ceratobasidium theobromae]
MLPAHSTKHHPLLCARFNAHAFYLAQADDGVANGTSLWLAGQVLAACLASLPRARIIELGSGIGFTALALASLGHDVLATDAHPAVLALLRRNVARNAPGLAGSVHVRQLDWSVPPDLWDWDHPTSITAQPPSQPTSRSFDLVITADTLYAPDLTPHLLRTITHIQALATDHPVTTYIAFERRDPALIDAALALIPHLVRIPRKKLLKAVHSVGWHWQSADLHDLEVHKLKS